MTRGVNFKIAKLLKEKGFEPTNKYYEPTIAEVVMWLYEKHNIWISPNPFKKLDNTTVWLYDIFLNDFIKDQLSPSQGVNNLTDAYLHAITQTLNNLI